MRGFTRVLRFALATQCARLMPRILLLGAPVAGFAAAVIAEGSPTEGARGLADALGILLPGLMLAGLALGTAALRGERGEDSLRSLLLTPQSRLAILLGCAAAATLMALSVALLAGLSAALRILATRAFGDVAPDGFFITESVVINQQVWRLAPLFFLALPAAVSMGALASTLLEDGLIAFLLGGALLFVPVFFTVPDAVPHASFALARHALHTLEELGCGRTELEATAMAPGYLTHHILLQIGSTAVLLAAASVIFRSSERA